MSSLKSNIAVAQDLALSRGTGYGVSAPEAAANLRILSDKITLSGTVANTEYVRFGKIPAGAKLIGPLSSLVISTGSTPVAGKVVLVPLDGSAVQEIASVNLNAEATSVGSFLDAADDVVVARDSWVHFVPGSALASTADVRARIVYAQLG